MTKHPKPGANNRGTSLFEVLMVIVILTVLINASATLYLATSRLSQLGHEALDIIADVEAARDEFHARVREAVSVVQRAGIYEASDDLLILRLQNLQDDGPQRFALLGHTRPGAPPTSIILAQNGDDFDLVHFQSMRKRIKSLEFAFGDDKNDLITLTIHVDNMSMENTVSEANTFIAAIRSHEPAP